MSFQFKMSLIKVSLILFIIWPYLVLGKAYVWWDPDFINIPTRSNLLSDRGPPSLCLPFRLSWQEVLGLYNGRRRGTVVPNRGRQRQHGIQGK